MSKPGNIKERAEEVRKKTKYVAKHGGLLFPMESTSEDAKPLSRKVWQGQAYWTQHLKDMAKQNNTPEMKEYYRKKREEQKIKEARDRRVDKLLKK